MPVRRFHVVAGEAVVPVSVHVSDLDAVSFAGDAAAVAGIGPDAKIMAKEERATLETAVGEVLRLAGELADEEVRRVEAMAVDPARAKKGKAMEAARRREARFGGCELLLELLECPAPYVVDGHKTAPFKVEAYVRY